MAVWTHTHITFDVTGPWYKAAKAVEPRLRESCAVRRPDLHYYGTTNRQLFLLFTNSMCAYHEKKPAHRPVGFGLLSPKLVAHALDSGRRFFRGESPQRKMVQCAQPCSNLLLSRSGGRTEFAVFVKNGSVTTAFEICNTHGEPRRWQVHILADRGEWALRHWRPGEVDKLS